jgi:hypothetical protein
MGLGQSMRATENDNLIEVAEILRSHVSSGKSYSTDTEKLKDLVPQAYRKGPRILRRAVAISHEDYVRLNSEGVITLKNSPLTSWTSSMDVAIAHARGLFSKRDERAVLIVEREIARKQIVVNVQSVFKAVGWNHPDVEEWGLYASKEKEFIVEMDERLNVVRLEDCRHIFPDQTHELLGPGSGELFWSQEDGNFLKVDQSIEKLDNSGPFAFRVLASDDTECAAYWDSTYLCWTLSDRLTPKLKP